jgi:hypothetical protein
MISRPSLWITTRYPKQLPGGVPSRYFYHPKATKAMFLNSIQVPLQEERHIEDPKLSPVSFSLPFNTSSRTLS